MDKRNTSDLIEAYLKEFLMQSNQIEINRSELAQLFECVPSQINYVMNTRFTLKQGYHVESKRGGGGYIRIIKLRFSTKHQYLRQMRKSIGKRITEKETRKIVAHLYEEKLITKREGHLILSALSQKVLGLYPAYELQLRAQLLHACLERLSYESEE